MTGFGHHELREARARTHVLFAVVVLFGFFVNLLVLTGPLYMLQVYDRVLASHSIATLVALSLLASSLFLAMGLLDYARGRVLARIGARFQHDLEERVFSAALRQTLSQPTHPGALGAQRDLEAIRALLASPAPPALFDIPWTPVFIAAIFFFHTLLGLVALIGGTIFVLLAVFNQLATYRDTRLAVLAGTDAERLATQMKASPETIAGLGMAGAGYQNWALNRLAAHRADARAADRRAALATLSRTFRLFMQSAMLGTGAYVVLMGEMSSGAMIAGSVLLGRALAPIEVAIAYWTHFQHARDGWTHLADLLARNPPGAVRTALPRPKARLEVAHLFATVPGGAKPVLRGLCFRIEPGQALGVIGPSASGKSALARVLTGVWKPSAGTVRLGGATLDQYDEDARSDYIGYLPQRVAIFDGTVAENIARLRIDPDTDAIIAAARAAGAHEMITGLPQGYDTRIGAGAQQLSGGQLQRIGLARALFGDPVLLILDEPNAALDNAGQLALNAAIRHFKSRGAAIVVMAHRPAAIQECDMLLVLDAGTRAAFGPRDQILREMVQNHTEIISAAAGAAR